MKPEISNPSPGISEIRLTLFERVTNKTGATISFDEVINMISVGKVKDTIEQIRATLDRRERDRLKKSLPAVTISGHFTVQRKGECLDQHSGLIQLDFDKVSDLYVKLKSLRSDEYCAAVFLSPSGDGIKAIVKIIPTEHEHAFISLCTYFKSKYNMSADPSCKDVSRLMYLSYDPDLTYNPNSSLWNAKAEATEIIPFLVEKLGFSFPLPEGSRNNSCFKLALTCRKENLNKAEVEGVFVELFAQDDFEKDEIQSIINSAWNQKKVLLPSISNSSNGKVTHGYTKIHAVENFITERYELRLNMVSQCLEYRNKNSSDPFVRLNEHSLYRQLQHDRIDIGMSKLQSLLMSDFVETYNPFEHYFEGLGAYDSEREPDYINQLIQYIKTKGQARFEMHFRKMLVRTIASSLEDKVFNKHAFILVQRKQNSGKSTFCRWLCPPSLSDYIAENINIMLP